MTYHHWLPGKRADQLGMAMKWAGVMRNHKSEWRIQDNDQNRLDTLIGEASSALTIAQTSDRTKVITRQLTTAFKAMITHMRFIKKHYFLPELLTAIDYYSLGLIPPDEVQTPIPPPTGQPEADYSFPGIHLILVSRIRTMAGGLPPDPRSNYGARIYWVFEGEPVPHDPFRVKERPVSAKYFPHSQWARRSRGELFDFPLDRGRRVYFCIRYENSKGQAGPWGPIVDLIVP